MFSMLPQFSSIPFLFFSSVISTCYFKEGVKKTTHFNFVIYIRYSSSM